MKLTRRQINTLLVLGGVTVLLFIGVFFLPWVGCSLQPDYPNGGGGGEVEAPVIPHDRFRAPRTSNIAHLNWELNIGGSGNEEVIAAFKPGDNIIIFGNTTSTDYDFYGEIAGYFVAVLNSNGTPLAYRTSEGTLERVHMVTAVDGVEDGFILAINTQTESLVKKVSLAGAENYPARVCVRSTLNPAIRPFERIVDIVIDDSNSNTAFHAIVEVMSEQNQNHKRLRVALIDRNLNITHNEFFTTRTGYSLEYLRAFAVGNTFRLFANARELTASGRSFLAHYEWQVGGGVNDNHRVISAPTNILFETIDIVPNSPIGGYVALIRTQTGHASLLNIRNNFTTSISQLGNNFMTNASLFSGGQNLYSFKRQSGGAGSLFRSNKIDAHASSPISGFGDFHSVNTVLRAGATNRTIVVGTNNDTLFISDIREQGVVAQRSFEARGVSIVQTQYLEGNGILLVGNSTSSGGAVGANFGGQDVWIAMVSI